MPCGMCVTRLVSDVFSMCMSLVYPRKPDQKLTEAKIVGKNRARMYIERCLVEISTSRLSPFGNPYMSSRTKWVVEIETATFDTNHWAKDAALHGERCLVFNRS